MKVAVIGAGCSGLTAIKSCLDEGLSPVCFEAHGDLGGLWRYTEIPEPEKGGVYASCVINTCKEMMSFSDFPVPANFPNSMPHSRVLEYFRLYAQHFNLEKHIRYRHRVKSLNRQSDDEGWVVVTEDETGLEVTHHFDAVMICSGHHCFPHRPSFPGLDKFQGEVIHSHEYKRPDRWRGKRVVVVGFGNSAVDIAVDISNQTSQTFISTRHGAWIFNRTGFYGYPMDAIANTRMFFSLPRSCMLWFLEKLSNFRFDHEMYGISPDHRPLEAHPTINDFIHCQINTGRIKVQPNIKEFGENCVEFSNGELEQIDAVILATGYEYTLPFLNQSIVSIEKNATEDLYKFTFPTSIGNQPKLAVIGLVQVLGAVMPVAELQCRWASRVFKGEATLPPKATMEAAIKEYKNNMGATYIKSQRHTIQAFWIQLMDELATEVGCRPHFLRLFLTSPFLAIRCYFGPCIPSQFRLHGPGQWSGAASTIETTFQRMRCGFKDQNMTLCKTREKRLDSKIPYSRINLCIIFTLIVAVIFRSVYYWHTEA